MNNERMIMPPTAANKDTGPWWRPALSLWLACCAALILCSLVGHMLIGLNTDHTDIMDKVGRLLSGGQPYVAYADINPPLIHILYILPWLLADATGLPQSSALALCAYALAAVSLACCYHILRSAGMPARGTLAATLTLGVALLFLSFQHQVFADREHLMVSLIMPWLVLCSPLAKPEDVPKRWRYAAAALAAPGFALKPYFMVFYAVTLCFSRPLKAQIQRREHWIIWGFFAAYGAVILIFFRAYITQMAPLVWHTYGNSSWPFAIRMDYAGRMFTQYWPLWCAILLAALYPRPRSGLMPYLAALLLAAYLSYLLNAGWFYTQYPFTVMAFLLAVWGGARMLRGAGPGGLRLLPPLALAACFILLMAYPITLRMLRDISAQRDHGHPMAYMRPDPRALEQLNRHLGTDSRYLFLGTNLRSLCLQEAERVSVGRYDHLWPLPGLALMRGEEGSNALYESLWPLFVNGITEDIALYRPTRIVVDISPRQMPLRYGFNIIGFLKADPAFAQAMQAYRLEERVDACREGVQSICAFDVYYLK